MHVRLAKQLEFDTYYRHINVHCHIMLSHYMQSRNWVGNSGLPTLKPVMRGHAASGIPDMGNLMSNITHAHMPIQGPHLLCKTPHSSRVN